MLRKPLAAILLSAVLCLTANYCLAFKEETTPGPADGVGVWANLWNYPEADLDAYCLRLRDHGVGNVFIQTSRSTTPAIKEPEKLGALIDTCHRHNIRVIAWSYAELVDPVADAEKMIEAANFTSPEGGHIDGIAPNMEKNLEAWRVEKYTKHIRSRLGANYPMMAVVYSPLNRCFEVARIPWKLLAEHYDVIAPMVYWNSRYQKIEPYSYTLETVRRIREMTGRADVEIHAIGDGMGTTSESFKQFMKACRESEVTGFSLYPNQKVTDEQLATLKMHRAFLAPNARFRMAAFRELVSSGFLDSPPARDPSRPVSRGDFYKLVVTQMYPALVAAKHSRSNWPGAVDCRHAGAVEAYGILVGLAHVADLGDNEPIENVLSAPISSAEARSLVAHVLEHDRRKSQKFGRHHRLDAWLAAPAGAESGKPVTAGVESLNYLDAAQIVIQGASALR